MSESLYTYGLVGKRLSHSFSARFFAEKWAQYSEKKLSYALFELAQIDDLPTLWAGQPALQGLNVTFPYKEVVCAYVDELDPLAQRIGAINVLKKLPNGRWRGYNTDYMGFKNTLALLPKGDWQKRPALICGKGGAGKAVGLALQDIGIRPYWVSRENRKTDLSYTDLQTTPGRLRDFGLLVQATPLGTHPNTEAPLLPYEQLQKRQLLYDLAYNPSLTPFLRMGIERGCYTKNGINMLYAQAEEAWKIWQTALICT